MNGVGTAQLAFGAEFAVFLVSLAGLACALRPGLLSPKAWARSALGSGFLALSMASFLRGSLVVADALDPALLVLRTFAAVVLAVGLIGWTGSRSRLVMAFGLVAMAAAAVLIRIDQETAADVLRAASAAVFAGALVSSARRSIPARIAVDAAGLVLAVVLLVAVAVSVTVSGNVDGQAEDRYVARAAAEADALVERARSGLGPARIVAGVLAAERGEVLARVADAPAPSASDADAVAVALSELTADRLLGLSDPVVYLSASGNALAASPGTVPLSTRLALAGDPVVSEAGSEQAERQGLTVIGTEAFALAAVPVRVGGDGSPERFVGTVVVARPLDETYLTVLGTAGEDLSFALVVDGGVVASTPGGPSDDALGALGRRALGGEPEVRLRTDSRYVAAVAASGTTVRPVVAFVVSAPADAAEETREDLFQVLFFVALGAALVAVALAALVGERIGRGLRRLTGAAEAMQAGDLDAAVEVDAPDELGVLGGAFTSMSTSIREMTDDLRAAAVQEAGVRARLEAVVSGMSEALLAVDRAGQVTECNRAAEDLLEMDRDDVVGRPVEEVVSWRLLDGRSVPLARTDLVDGEPMAADLAVGDRSTPVVVTSGTLVGGDGRPDGAVVVLRDIRREQEVEDLKSSILANIGHELRTPLTPIKGYAGMLRDRDVGRDRTKVFAEEIIGGVDQLERVIRQLVTFATIAAGNLHPEAAPVDAERLGEAVRHRWAGRVDPAIHRFSVVVDEGAPDAVVDGGLLGQAIDELVDNAVKYSPDGGDVTVRFEAGTDGWTGLKITVVDQGVGMPADQLAGLSEAFTQFDGSDTRRFGGLGLGLACADRIVRAHGGLLAQSAPSQGGTEVSILLPMDAAAGPPSSDPTGEAV